MSSSDEESEEYCQSCKQFADTRKISYCCCCGMSLCRNCNEYHDHDDCVHDITDVDDIVDMIIKLLKTKNFDDSSIEKMRGIYTSLKNE
jgi:hypothetical protein